MIDLLVIASALALALIAMHHTRPLTMHERLEAWAKEREQWRFRAKT